MTREELIDAIDRQIVIAPPFILGGYTMFLHSLRAVVELHKPDVQGRCDICTWITNGGGVVYEACPTIQAIEKELQYD